MGVLRKGEIWLVDGPRGKRLRLIISGDLFNATDVPVVLVAEVVEGEVLRDSPLAFPAGVDRTVLPDRLNWTTKSWLVERVDVLDADAVAHLDRALRVILDC